MPMEAPDADDIAVVQEHLRRQRACIPNQVWLAIHHLLNYAEYAEPRLRKLSEFATFLNDQVSEGS